MRFAALALFAGSAFGCSTRSDSTSLVIDVESDLAVGSEIDAIAVNGHSISLVSAADLPVVVAFTPSGASDEPIAVTAVARWHGTDVVEQSVTTSFQPGKALLLVMRLDRFCLRVTCDANQTCESGVCGPKSRRPGPYTGSKDASTGDAPVDTAPSSDGATPDRPRDGTGQIDNLADRFVDRDAADSGPIDTALAIDGQPVINDAGDGASPDVPIATCGDGVKDLAAGETCDYLGGADRADCNGIAAPLVLRCRGPVCGDGYVNMAAGEICDQTGGADRADCNGLAAGPLLSCKASLCGDGYVNAAAGETCDDGNQLPGDGCSSPACQVEPGFVCPAAGQPCRALCGDGLKVGSEACDDFNSDSCGTCNAVCTAAQPAGPASGTIGAVQASITSNGETFQLSDGIHGVVTFEFNDNTPTDSAHVQIVRSSSTSIQMAARIAAAINGVGAGLAINAQVNSASRSQVLLTNKNPGSQGNVNFAETIGNFAVTAMTGGSGFDCAIGSGCRGNDDCQSSVCCLGTAGTATCPCPSGVICNKNRCLTPSCTDSTINGKETDQDCGGDSCPKCTAGQTCMTGGDCASGICTQSICAAPSCSDHVLNGTETDVDCGGSCSGCTAGSTCNVLTDCSGALNCTASAGGGPKICQ